MAVRPTTPPRPLPADALGRATGGGKLGGTGGNDALQGDFRDNEIYPGGGDDIAGGGAGNDDLVDFGGHDTLLGGAGDDDIFDAAGNDVLDGGSGDDWVYAGPGNDTIIVADGNDTVIAADGDDRLVWVHTAGNTRFDGGEGSNVLEMKTLVGVTPPDGFEMSSDLAYAVLPDGSFLFGGPASGTIRWGDATLTFTGVTRIIPPAA